MILIGMHKVKLKIQYINETGESEGENESVFFSFVHRLAHFTL